MHKRFIGFAMASVLVAGSAFGLALAATQAVTVDIGFEFQVKEKVFPAGRYEIRPDGDKSRLTIRNSETGDSVLAMVLTRLANRGGNKVEVYFDTVGEKRYLSEVHIPGSDGYELYVAPATHTHSGVVQNEQNK